MQSGKMRKQGLSGKRHAGHLPGHAMRVAAEMDPRVGVFRQPVMQTPVLVLNASYEPINICGARRALVLVLKGVARTEEEHGEILVACCHACNRRKGNAMLHELTDMRLKREPRPFSLHTSRHIMRMIGSADAA